MLLHTHHEALQYKMNLVLSKVRCTAWDSVGSANMISSNMRRPSLLSFLVALLLKTFKLQLRQVADIIVRRDIEARLHTKTETMTPARRLLDML